MITPPPFKKTCPCTILPSLFELCVISHQGPQIESLTMSCGFQQLTSDPTHLLANSSSCTDLIFTDYPNLVVDNGVYPSLHPICHHQITYCKCNLTIKHPPPMKILSGIIKRLTQNQSNKLFY